MSCEHVRGSPPPRMSSSDGIPVEVVYVDVEPGCIRVPRGCVGCFEVTRRLNEDMTAYSRVQHVAEDEEAG